MLFIQITLLRFAQRRLSRLICSVQLSFIMPCINLLLIGLKFSYAPSQGSSWESIVNLFKNALYRTL